jgi:hypothetical protein
LWKKHGWRAGRDFFVQDVVELTQFGESIISYERTEEIRCARCLLKKCNFKNGAVCWCPDGPSLDGDVGMLCCRPILVPESRLPAKPENYCLPIRWFLYLFFQSALTRFSLDSCTISSAQSFSFRGQAESSPRLGLFCFDDSARDRLRDAR